jgi:hypothetical protein
MLWSILNSGERGEDIQNVLLVPVDFTSSMVPMVSMIPVNMRQKSEFWRYFEYFVIFGYICRPKKS